nr:heme-binding protein [uncultured Pseudomonas sp.]
MNLLNLQTATAISTRALAVGREINAAPLTVAVLDAGGHLISLQREDGASLLRPQIAIGKAWGAMALGKDSRLIAADAQQRPAFIGAVNNLADGKLVPAPGGVLIRNEQGEVIGAVGITGDTSDIDEQCAISALESLGLTAGVGGVA